ncbi:putative glycolipid-binding domain-containing protein [Sagittula sp. S175]|uniref:putative glycolipid-binding domain-containing protein n=1 Tax=Sagittula sp. S175 TaxID=3415129 RepID=UPI003C7C1FA4
MTETVATAHWRALDREGEDKSRLARADGGYILIGHARFRDGAGRAALDYVVRCGPDWRTTSADITGDYAEEQIAWKFTRTRGDWTFNGSPAPELQDAEDIDLAFTPATNLMPLRRLPQVGRLETTSAWVRLPGPTFSILTQSYTRERGNYVRYTALESDYETHLAVNEDGFVTRYPGLWDWVDA